MITRMKWLGWINIYFAVAALLGVVYLFLTQNKLNENSIPVVEKSVATPEVEDIKQVRGEVRPGYDLSALITYDDAKAAKGKEVYTASCAGCHGANGSGDGMPTARNFAKLEGWTGGHTLAAVFEVLTNGNAKGMPAFSTLSVDDRMAVAQYIRTLGKGYEPAGASDIAELEKKFNLSQPKKASNQVPVQVAIEQISTENEAIATQVQSLNKLVADKKKYASLVEDASIVVQFLAQHQEWKQSPEVLKSLVAKNEINGFKVASHLSHEDLWKDLFVDLSKII